MEKENESVEQFYQDVADLLGVENNYRYDEFTVGGTYRTRWNNRKPGNGRFEGYGLIRFFGPNCIHVVLHKPAMISGVFNSTEEVLSALKKALD
jgi:hypothetical protein